MRKRIQNKRIFKVKLPDRELRIESCENSKQPKKEQREPLQML